MEEENVKQAKGKMGDRMKGYEKDVLTIFPQDKPLVLRLDGKNFSKFTRDLEKDVKPFSTNFCLIMQDLAKYLFTKYNATASYVVSDEVSLIFVNTNIKAQHPFGGKAFKIQSIIAADASVFFNSKLAEYLPAKVGTFPLFDCRAFIVPSVEEANNCIVWRARDGQRNAISTAARCFYSAAQLIGINKEQQLTMLKEKEVEFYEKFPRMMYDGTTYVRHEVSKPYTAEELESLPPMHNARKNPDLVVTRPEVLEIHYKELFNYLSKLNENEGNNNNQQNV